MICAACGEDNPVRAKFCLGCGSSLVVAPAPGRAARKTVTVVFCDLTGSTSLGERLDSESLRLVMERFFEEMRGALERHGGTVEKFIGDAVMAVFGVPVVREDDALRAVRAAVDMRSALGELNDELEARWGARLRTRTGVNTGEVVTAEQSFAVGDAVNVAARLEQAAGPGEILIGRRTLGLVREWVEVEPVEALVLKGKSEAVAACRLVSVHARTPDAGPLGAALVGRDRELGLLRKSFEQTVTDRGCRLVVVLGAAGVGKSRLVRGFTDRLPDDVTVLRGSCLPYGEGITYWPIAEALRPAARIADDDSPVEAVGKLTGLLSPDADAAGVAALLSGVMGLADEGAQQAEMFWAVRRLLEALARRGPLVVVLDDLQWAEDTLCDLLAFLIAGDRVFPIMLAALARPELREARPEFLAAPGVSTLGLEPLDTDGGRELLADLLDDVAAGTAVVERILAVSAGNPLFVQELVRMLIDDGLLHRGEEGWSATGDLSVLPLPGTIEALLAARLERLTADERAVTEGASVIGEEFWREAIRVLSPQSMSPRLSEHLQSLVDKEVVRRSEPSLMADDAYRFHHILVRDAAYAGMLKGVRAELHQRFAEWLERRAGERVLEVDEIVGYHLEQAYRYRAELGPLDEAARELGVRAGRRLADSGRRALGRGDCSAAVKLLQRARTLLPADAQDSLEAGLDLMTAHRDRADLERAATLGDELMADGQGLEDAGLAMRIRLQHALAQFDNNQLLGEELEELAREAMAACEKAGDAAGLALAWDARYARHVYEDQWVSAVADCEQLLNHARRAGDQRMESEALGGLVQAWVEGPTPAEEGIRRIRELLDDLKARPFVEAIGQTHLALPHAMRGDFAVARSCLRRGLELLEELGVRLHPAYIWTQVGGYVELLAGDLQASEREHRRAYEFFAATSGANEGRAESAARLAETLCLQGRDAEARHYLDASAEAAATSGPGEAWLRATAARLLVQRGEFDRARTMADEATALAQGTDGYKLRFQVAMALAEVLAATGPHEQAATAARQALALCEAKGNRVGAHAARELLNQASA